MGLLNFHIDASGYIVNTSINFSLMDLLPYICLWTAISLTWRNGSELYRTLLIVLSIVLAAITGVITPTAIVAVSILLIFYMLWDYLVRAQHPARSSIIYQSVVLIIVFLSIGLGAHGIPGFNNFTVVKDVQLSEGSVPYSLYWSYDKAIAGTILLALCIQQRHTAKIGKKIYSVNVAIATILVLLITVMPIGAALGYVKFDPKVPSLLLWWIPSNLLITCIAEEALFRGLIQERLDKFLNKHTRLHAIYALVITSILFGAVHINAGDWYIIPAFVAGLGYGAAYLLTHRIEVCIMVHFVFNLAHLLLFSYPMLMDG